DDARHFLGLAIVEAHGISSAIMRAHELGIAPGRGVVLQFAVPPHDVSQRDRLLGADEALPLVWLLQARARADLGAPISAGSGREAARGGEKEARAEHTKCGPGDPGSAARPAWALPSHAHSAP